MDIFTLSERIMILPTRFQRFFFCLLTCFVSSAAAENQAASKAVNLKKFLEKNEQKLSLLQKMRFANELLTDLERLHENEPVKGPITIKNCFVSPMQSNNLPYPYSLRQILKVPNYSISHHVQNLGKILAKVTNGHRHARDKKRSVLPTYKRFKRLISSMRNPDTQVRKTPAELKIAIKKIMKDQVALRKARKNAALATHAILKRCKNSGLKKREIFKLALFIDFENCQTDQLKERGATTSIAERPIFPEPSKLIPLTTGSIFI